MERNAKLALARTAIKLLDAQSSKFQMSVSRTDFVSNPQNCAFCTLDYSYTAFLNPCISTIHLQLQSNMYSFCTLPKQRREDVE